MRLDGLSNLGRIISQMASNVGNVVARKMTFSHGSGRQDVHPASPGNAPSRLERLLISIRPGYPYGRTQESRSAVSPVRHRKLEPRTDYDKPPRPPIRQPIDEVAAYGNSLARWLDQSNKPSVETEQLALRLSSYLHPSIEIIQSHSTPRHKAESTSKDAGEIHFELQNQFPHLTTWRAISENYVESLNGDFSFRDTRTQPPELDENVSPTDARMTENHCVEDRQDSGVSVSDVTQGADNQQRLTNDLLTSDEPQPLDSLKLQRLTQYAAKLAQYRIDDKQP